MNTQILRILRHRGRMVTIPPQIRQALGLRYNDILSFTVLDGDTFAVKRESLCGAPCKNLKGRGKKRK